MVRLQPSLAKARAMARPIPDVEPVTMTDLPLSMAVTFRKLYIDHAAALLRCNKNVNAPLSRLREGRAARNHVKSRYGFGISRTRPRSRPLRGGCSGACRGAVRQARRAVDPDAPACARGAVRFSQAARRLRDHRSGGGAPT